MKARLLLSLTALLFALTSWAVGVEIDGIHYLLNSSTNTATVARYTSSTNNNPNAAYKGNITIPASVSYGGTTYTVTSIGDEAFKECTGLTSISIPSSVTNIGGWAFEGCTGLASINLPASVTTIGDDAFWCCTGLTSINIPSSVTAIGHGAFLGCSSLTDIYARHTDPKAYHCSDYAFSDVPFSTCTLHVPIGSKEAYANTAPWSKFKNIAEGAAQTARHPVQSRTHKQKGARKGGSNTKKSK